MLAHLVLWFICFASSPASLRWTLSLPVDDAVAYPTAKERLGCGAFRAACLSAAPQNIWSTMRSTSLNSWPLAKAAAALALRAPSAPAARRRGMGREGAAGRPPGARGLKALANREPPAGAGREVELGLGATQLRHLLRDVLCRTGWQAGRAQGEGAAGGPQLTLGAKARGAGRDRGRGGAAAAVAAGGGAVVGAAGGGVAGGGGGVAVGASQGEEVGEAAQLLAVACRHVGWESEGEGHTVMHTGAQGLEGGTPGR